MSEQVKILGNKIEEFNPKRFTYFVKPTYYDMSNLKLEGLKKTAKIIQWGRRAPIKFCERFMGIEFLDYQKYVFMQSWITPYVVWCMSRNGGKALDLKTRIPTPDGDKTMGEIHVGDYVFDEKGQPTKVIYESPIYKNHQCYEVTFEDGEKIIADAEHNWYVHYKCRTIDNNDCLVRTTEEMYQNYIHVYDENTKKAGYIEYKYRVDRSQPVQYNKKKLPIHPYILGLWLGDDKSGDGYINVHNADCEETCKNILSCGYKIYSITNDRNTQKRIRIHLPDNTPLKIALRNLNEFKEKYIPNDYLYSSISDRIYLLQGLMDTDGSIDERGKCEFSQCVKHKKIIDGISLLLTSLGIKYNIYECFKKCNKKFFQTYKIGFITDKTIPAFMMKRKYIKLRDSIKQDKTNKKSIVKIEKVESRPVKCIQVASDSHLYLCGNKNTITHNTTLGSPFLMAKVWLLPKFEGYILSGTGSQSIGMMKKIEQITKKEIASFTGLTDVFMNELVKSQANSTGFIHNPSSWSFKIYSGSSLATINSNYDGSRGKRSRLNFYDEAAYIPEELFTATLPFVTQNSDFALGGNIDVSLLPPNFPNQIIMASSAGSMDHTFYKRYKKYALHSIAGDKRYACFDIDCDLIMNATYNGKVYPVPLLTQEKIDSEMKLNPIKATREYKNKFDADNGEEIIIKKAQILRNSITRPPELANTDNSKYVLAYDPAKKKDNSVIGIGKVFYDDRYGWKMEIVNCVNLLDKKTKRPITTPEQIEQVRELLIAYNGYGNPDYVNIEKLLIDAGAGGGATQILDFLFSDFYEYGHEKDGEYKHYGLIDRQYEYCIPYISRYPNAIDKIVMVEPKKYKVQIFTELIEMIEQDLISFPAEYDYHGVLNIIDEKNGEYIEHTYKLSPEEEVALKQIDAMKEEITHMYRYTSSNKNIRYDLAPGFENQIGDDRAYVLALLGHYLFQLRSEDQNTRNARKTTNKQLLERLTSNIHRSSLLPKLK